MKSVKDIQHCFYINLDKRPDRKQHVESQLNKLGIPYERFRAIQMENGAIGCSMSHLSILRKAKEQNLPHVMIVEDDIKFLNPVLLKKQITQFLTTIRDFDVLLIGGNNMPPFKEINDSCIKVSRCQTTTGYLVKQHYYDILIDNIKTGIGKLLKEPQQHILYAIDKYWFRLQERDKWYLITPLTVIQREDYSDIEKRATNYARGMLDLDKVEFFKYQEKIRQKLLQSPRLSLYNR
jgi:glycosyl transferase, family 25